MLRDDTCSSGVKTWIPWLLNSSSTLAVGGDSPSGDTDPPSDTFLTVRNDLNGIVAGVEHHQLRQRHHRRRDLLPPIVPEVRYIDR